MNRRPMWLAGVLLLAGVLTLKLLSKVNDDRSLLRPQDDESGIDATKTGAGNAAAGERQVLASPPEVDAAENLADVQVPIIEVCGVAIDSFGVGVVGAAVRARSVQTSTGARGVFVLGLPASEVVDGMIVLSASTESGLHGAARIQAERREPVTILLSKPRTITVAVSRSQGGAAAGVLVSSSTFSDFDDRIGAQSSVTSPEGRVELRNIPAIPMVIRTQSADTIPTQQIIGPGDRDQEVHVIVEPGPAVSLSAVDEAGRPVSGASAAVYDLVNGNVVKMKADAAGRFPVTGLTSHPHKIMVTHRDYASAIERVQSSVPFEKQVVLHSSQTIEVTVGAATWEVADEGYWVVEARVNEHDDIPTITGATSSKRVAILSGLDARYTYTLVAQYRHRSGSCTVGPMLIKGSVHIDVGRMRLAWQPPDLLRVVVQCRTPEGDPIAEGVVSLVSLPRPSSVVPPASDSSRSMLRERCDVSPDEHGDAVGYVSAGTYRIDARSPIARSQHRNVDLVVQANCEVKVVFVAGRSIRGVVLSADLSPACREVVAEATGCLRKARSDDEGRFELRGVPDGACKVWVYGRYGEPVAAAVDVRVAGADIDDCDVVLREGAIVGRVLGTRGERARISAFVGGSRGVLAESHKSLVVWTDPQGGFRIDGICVGDWNVIGVTESEYGKGVWKQEQVGGVGDWSGVVEGVTEVVFSVAWN